MPVKALNQYCNLCKKLKMNPTYTGLNDYYKYYYKK